MNTRIEAASLTTFEVDQDGLHVRLNFLDKAGESACLELPADSLNQLLMSVPRMMQTALRNRFADSSLRFVHPLDDFTLELGEPDSAGRPQFILTLATGAGFAVSFVANADGLSNLAQAAVDESRRDDAGIAAAVEHRRRLC